MADEKQFSRRDFLKTTGAATGGIIGGSLLGGLIGFNMNDSDAPSENKTDTDTSTGEENGNDQLTSSVPSPSRVFLDNDDDFQTIEAAMERIFPETKLGPGAKELGAAYFLDNQLVGEYGTNAKEYMQGPFKEGLGTQGLQTNLNRQEYYRLGIEKIRNESKDRHDKEFYEISEDEQDALLKDMENNKVDFGVPASTATSAYFFKMLRSATMEGVYSDPVYRGNRNMGGWKMKQFPGHQHSYLNLIEEDEFQEIEPVPNYVQ